MDHILCGLPWLASQCKAIKAYQHVTLLADIPLPKYTTSCLLSSDKKFYKVIATINLCEYETPGMDPARPRGTSVTWLYSGCCSFNSWWMCLNDSALLTEPPVLRTEPHAPSRPLSDHVVLLTAVCRRPGIACYSTSVTLPHVSLWLRCYSNHPGSPLNSLSCSVLSADLA